jgi:hypothetical protein
MSGICGDTTTVTQPVYIAAQKTNFCTKPCCTSADCDGQTVCMATASGGNYCVRPEWLDRSPQLGSALGGAPCELDASCRSGLCTMGTCADVCCSTAQSPSECAGSAVCQFGTFPGRGVDKRFVPFCAAPGGSAATGSVCSAGSGCRSGFCAGDNRCHDACRTSADCGDPALECGYAIPSLTVGGIVSACESSFGGASAGAQGAACANNNGCQSGFCDATSMRCTDVCYGDADCMPPGWSCRPEVVTFLGSASYTVLACGP